jgi:energy-coupling factor transporter ATP-binding protein EcfA2
MSFRIIAIRPLIDCNNDYVKILKEGVPYIFYNQFDFSKYTDDNKVFNLRDVEEIDLYSIPKGAGQKAVNINLSAIVGKNGSGKSSIVELMYVTLFNLSVINEVLYNEETRRFLTVVDRVEDIRVELFYQLNGEFHLIHLDDDEIFHYKSSDGNFTGSFVEDLNWKEFFYTTAVNYSHYALNSLDLGPWIKNIFHKNDAYQTPIVVNPMRTEGNVDINTENYLVRSRLLANVLSENKSLRELAKGKTVEFLKFTLDERKINRKNNFPNTDKYGALILPQLYEKYFSESKVDEDYVLNKYAIEYILRKIDSICKKYKQYKKFRKGFREIDVEIIKKYISELYDDKSHITFKLRQAIYFLLYGSCIDEDLLGILEPINKLSEILKSIHNDSKLDLIEIIPPSFFICEIYFDKKNNTFEKLSSGEKQNIYSVTSLTYHLFNLDSVKETYTPNATINKTIVLYRHINIIFDEIELYYHPDLQRIFIFELIESIKRIQLKNITDINCIFVTHSPFILSDIPNHNILFLDINGTPTLDLNVKTFGANIHDLLKHSFFLENGSMGEFAKTKINDTIKWLHYKKLENEVLELNAGTSDREKALLLVNQKELVKLKNEVKEFDIKKHRDLIDIIDEPILKQKLSELFDQVTGENLELSIVKQKILELQKHESELLLKK